ncbi:MAG TPA: cytochrome P450 [Amnibacterium sp.]|nr:cytochrome P450 [Amnibacterium sp.]
MPNDALPRLRGDRTAQLLADAYHFVGTHADRLGADGFRTRIAGRPITCLRGADAARFFYEGGRFGRSGAIPAPTRRLLQDDGSVQALEGEAHLDRKQRFLAVLDAEGRRSMLEAFDEAWEHGRGRRSGRDVRIRDEAVSVLGDAVLAWAGVPRDQDEAGGVTAELESMFEHAGRFGPSNLVAQLRRGRTERRARRWIERARAGAADAGGPLAEVAAWTDEAGDPLPVAVAAVELLNLLRPTVAVADFLVYAALALAVRPSLREPVRSADGTAGAFATEVRRHAPFFPVIAGTAARAVEWRGHGFEQGAWVLLDLFGTNHDARLWPEPQRFRPERFLEDGAAPEHVVAQGAGAYAADHRCPGEPATQALVERFAQRLAEETWAPAVPPDARIRYGRIPALPRTPLVLRFA